VADVNQEIYKNLKEETLAQAIPQKRKYTNVSKNLKPANRKNFRNDDLYIAKLYM